MRDPLSERWLDDYMYPAIPPRFGCDESYFGTCTREQGAAFLRGELDYCPECCELAEPYEGEVCEGCTPELSHAEQDARDTGLPLSWRSHQSATHDHDGNIRRWRR